MIKALFCHFFVIFIVNIKKRIAPKAPYDYSAPFGIRNLSISFWEKLEKISQNIHFLVLLRLPIIKRGPINAYDLFM